MRLTPRKAIPVTSLWLCALGAIAQNDSISFKRSYYCFYGYGVGGQRIAEILGVTAQVADQYVLAITMDHTARGTSVDYPIFGSLSTIRQTETYTVAIVFGKIFKRKWGYVSFLGGPSTGEIIRYRSPSPYFTGYLSGEEKEIFGLNFQGNVFLARKLFGIGLCGFANVNQSFSHAGVSLAFNFGRVHFMRATYPY